MERENIKKLIMRNASNFPQFYNKMDDQLFKVQIDTWGKLFADYDNEIIEACFMQALKTAQYPVKPSDIFTILDAQTKSTMPTIDELYKIASDTADAMLDYYSRERGWENEWGAKKSGFEMATEIYNKMPPLLKEWKQRPIDLVKWYLEITNDNESYIRREFEQIIKTRMARRETLGIGYDQEFKPLFDAKGCLKEIPKNDKKYLTADNDVL